MTIINNLSINWWKCFLPLVHWKWAIAWHLCPAAWTALLNWSCTDKNRARVRIHHMFSRILNFSIFYCFLDKDNSYIHSMARGNLNKSEWLVTNTTAALEYIAKRPRICINWNPPFQTLLQRFFKNCLSWSKSYFKKSHLKVLLLSVIWSEREDFNWYRF